MKQAIKFISLLLGMAVIIIVSTSQKAKTTNIPKQVMNDSTAIISITDANNFIKLLGTVPHDQYGQLDPKTVVKEFVEWKLREINSKKQLPDSTNKKK